MKQTKEHDVNDTLNLSHDKACQKMLHKQGNNFPKPEKVIYSGKLVKINRKGKEQERVLCVTDKAIYNLMPNDLSKCRRRIGLESVESVIMSSTSDEFTIHIPDEYDYRFKSVKKQELCAVLKSNIPRLAITKISQSSLLSVTVTKDVSRLQTREERLRRYQELMDLTPSDEEEEKEMLHGNAKPFSNENNNNNNVNHVKVEDFEFLKVIGRGSFGKVMQVKKKDSGEILAMKILKKKSIIARHQVEHTKSERSILLQLQHPFLMRLRFAFHTSNKLYFVLDYYRGGELFFHLKKKRRFSEKEAQIIVAETALALGHLHSLGVIYRDLKPENILLDHNGHICLTDFGLSKQQKTSSTFCGTPEYLAPEIVVNIGHSKEVDWWSLGILLYELTVGIPPFYSQNINEMYKKIQQYPLQFPPQTTVQCRSLISLLLERNPRKRLGSGSDDVDEIKRHPFFRSIDWKLLIEKKIEAVYKPNVKNEYDTSNFDKQFTSEPVAKTIEAENDKAMNQGTDDNDDFEEFSFVPIPDVK